MYIGSQNAEDTPKTSSRTKFPCHAKNSNDSVTETNVSINDEFPDSVDSSPSLLAPRFRSTGAKRSLGFALEGVVGPVKRKGTFHFLTSSKFFTVICAYD